MRHNDFAPLYRSTVGFDRLFNLLDNVAGGETNASTYPPYNIELTGENAYRITMAVAGFGKDDLDLEVKENTLTVKGALKSAEQNETKYLHHGIAGRSFERRFQLADHVEIKGADLKDGLLHIDLAREIPESLKPRTIQIGSGTVEATALEAAE